MKRSEMVNLLYDKLLELYMVDFSTEERAEFLLKSIEEAGMLPPLQDHIYPRLFVRDDEYVDVNSLEWEPEEDDSPSAESVEDATTEEEH
jgi:hypothetical protein